MMSRTRRPALATSLSVAFACALGCSQSGKQGGVDAMPSPRDTGSAPVAAPATCQPSRISASQVVFLGESFVALTRAIPTLLSERARAAGTIAMTESYRDFSVAGTELATGALRAQYRRAKKAGPIKLVLINGGESDLMFGGRCAAGYDERCRAITDAAGELLAELRDDGVQDASAPTSSRHWRRSGPSSKNSARRLHSFAAAGSIRRRSGKAIRNTRPMASIPTPPAHAPSPTRSGNRCTTRASPSRGLRAGPGALSPLAPRAAKTIETQAARLVRRASLKHNGPAAYAASPSCGNLSQRDRDYPLISSSGPLALPPAPEGSLGRVDGSSP
jgi:hypothetical protein